jgi:hypothetical protein
VRFVVYRIFAAPPLPRPRDGYAAFIQFGNQAKVHIKTKELLKRRRPSKILSNPQDNLWANQTLGQNAAAKVA